MIEVFNNNESYYQIFGERIATIGEEGRVVSATPDSKQKLPPAVASTGH